MSKKKFIIILCIAVLLKISVIWFTYDNYGENDYVGHYARDLDCWFDMFDKIDAGKVPLVDFPKEYPAGSIVLNWALSFFYSNPHQFLLVYGTFMLLLDMAVAAVLWKILRFEKKESAATIVLIYLFLPTILVLNHVRFDIVPTFLAILAYYQWKKGRSVLPAILLGIGASIKWFPAFLVVGICLNEIFVRKRLRKAVGIAFASLSGFIIMDVPFLLLNYFRGNNFSDWISSYSENYGYRICPDSLPGVIQMVSNIRFSSEFILAITSLLFLLVVLLHKKKNVASNYVLYCFTFLLFNKIYSPQFHIWFLPFLLLCLPAKGYWKFWKMGPEAGIPAILGLEVVNILIYPFSFTWFLNDVGSFTYAPLLSARIFSLSIILRAFLLLWTGWALWRKH